MRKELKLRKSTTKSTLSGTQYKALTILQHKLIISLLDDFSLEEFQRFQTRFEEGYDLPPTGRYALWLKKYYPGLDVACMVVIQCFL